MKLFLALVVVVIGANFGWVSFAEAQTTTLTKVCQSNSDGKLYAVPSGGCPTGYTPWSVSGTYPTLCVSNTKPYDVSPPASVNDSGGTRVCPTGTTEQGTKTPIPTNTTTPPSGTKPGGTQSTTSQSSSTSAVGDCGSGFTPKGPLCIPNNPFTGNGIAASGSIGQLATSIISILLGLAGIVAVIFLIIGGYTWMTARGNEAQVVSGRKTVVNAIIGLIIVVMSYLIIQVITSFLVNGPGQ
jgi:hypothetical protein